jgi:hypothetical protein
MLLKDSGSKPDENVTVIDNAHFDMLLQNKQDEIMHESLKVRFPSHPVMPYQSLFNPVIPKPYVL